MQVTQLTSPNGNTLGDQVWPFSLTSFLQEHPPCSRISSSVFSSGMVCRASFLASSATAKGSGVVVGAQV